MTIRNRVIKKVPNIPGIIGDDSYMFLLETAARKDHQHKYTTPIVQPSYQNGFSTFSAFTKPLTLWTIGNLVFIEGVIKHSGVIVGGAALTIVTVPLELRPLNTPVGLISFGATSVRPADSHDVQLNSVGDIVYTPDATVLPYAIGSMNFQGAAYVLR